MTISDEINHLNTIFIDTAPVIYYIEAHPQYGDLTKEVFDAFQSGKLSAYSSVVTLTEVLSKPIESGNEKLARKFAEFLKHGSNFFLIEISANIAERAGRLRGQYLRLRTVDALQISTAMDMGADAFLTNDEKLKQLKEIKVLVLKDFIPK